MLVMALNRYPYPCGYEGRLTAWILVCIKVVENMATHSIGKLKFDLSGKGFSYRWGDDGKVHHLFQGRQQASADDDYLNEVEPLLQYNL